MNKVLAFAKTLFIYKSLNKEENPFGFGASELRLECFCESGKATEAKHGNAVKRERARQRIYGRNVFRIARFEVATVETKQRQNRAWSKFKTIPPSPNLFTSYF